MTVHADLVNTGELVETVNGVSHTRHYLVTGLSGTGPQADDNALRAAGIPLFASPHPTVPGIHVIERRVTPVTDSPTKRHVTVRWGRATADQLAAASAQTRTGDFGPTRWSGRPGTATVETTRDAFGTQMLIPYWGKPALEYITLADYTVAPRAWDNFFAAAALSIAQKDVTTLNLTASRWERRNPEAKARDFGGHTNLSGWRSFPPRSVLAIGMSFTEDATGGYQVQYNFTFSPDGWQFTDTIKLEGKPPIDVDNNNGQKTWDIYPAVDFGRYRL